MLREKSQFSADKWGMRPVERSCTASGCRNKTAAHKFEIADFASSCLLRTVKELAMRLMLISRGVLCGVLLCAGTAGYGQAQSNAAADRDMADRYYRAARAGDDVAQFYLGSLYSAGVGRPQSDTEAFEWIQRAAQRGNAQAMLVAGGLTALGKGTPKDYVVSYKWAFLVAEGSQMVDMKNGGRQLISMLQPRMTADEIQRAKTQAYQFRAVGTVATTATPAAAPAPIPPTIVAPAPPAPSLQSPAPPAVGPQQSPRLSTAPLAQPAASASGGTPAQSPAALEAQKHLGKENVDRMIKNMPPEYRRRFGL
jgi:Sel1 repeat